MLRLPASLTALLNHNPLQNCWKYFLFLLSLPLFAIINHVIIQQSFVIHNVCWTWKRVLDTSTIYLSMQDIILLDKNKKNHHFWLKLWLTKFKLNSPALPHVSRSVNWAKEPIFRSDKHNQVNLKKININLKTSLARLFCILPRV